MTDNVNDCKHVMSLQVADTRVLNSIEISAL